MAIVVYKCNVCNRERNYIRNITGMERINKCTITKGCRGELYQLKVLEDFIRSTTPEKVLGLDEWRKRGVLFEHSQSVSRNSWLVQHNLGTFPAISVFIDIPTEADPNNREEVKPDKISIVDENNLIIYFDVPRSGLAQLVARQSKDVNKTSPLQDSIQQSELIKISIGGVITIASRLSTLGADDNMNMNAVYLTSQNTIIEKTYNVPTISSTVDPSSAWKDFDRVFIRGKVFLLRILNGIYSAMIDNTISNGSTLYFNELTIGSAPVDIINNELLILYSIEPNDTIDKVTDKYVDIGSIDMNSPILYNAGEFYIDSKLIKNVYPLIQEAAFTV